MKKKLGILVLILVTTRLCESYSDSEESEESTTVSSRRNSDSDISKAYFIVTANRLLRLNKPYRVSIQFQGYESKKILEVGIKNRNFEDFKDVTLFGSASKTVEFLVSKFLFNFFQLEVNHK